VRTIDEALLFAQQYRNAKRTRMQHWIIDRLLSAVTPQSERDAANDFRDWAEAEGLLQGETAHPKTRTETSNDGTSRFD
jgi:hypothetical protein